MNKKIKFFNKNIVILFFITMFFVLDRILKYYSLRLKGDVVLIKNILKFTFFPNKYISFSIPLSGVLLKTLLAVFLLALFIYLLFLFKRRRYLDFWPWLAVFLGALSNLIDRVFFSYVVDYFDLSYFSVFNLADALIFLACFYIIFSSFKEKNDFK